MTAPIGCTWSCCGRSGTALRIHWIGLVSVILLVGARLRERAERPRLQPAEVKETTEESRADALAHVTLRCNSTARLRLLRADAAG